MSDGINHGQKINYCGTCGFPVGVCRCTPEEMQAEMQRYFESLDSALLDYMRGKTSSFDEHCERFGLSDKIPANPVAKTGAVMKMVTSRTNLAMWARVMAKRWLDNHSFKSWDDGDVKIESK